MRNSEISRNGVEAEGKGRRGTTEEPRDDK